MKFQAATDGPRGRVLNGNFFAFLRDLIATIRQISDVKLQRKPARLRIPKIQAGGQISRQVLWKAGAPLHHRPASVTQPAATPETAPMVMLEELSRGRMRLVERWHNALARKEYLVAGKSACYRTVEERSGQGILEPTTDTNSFQLPHVQNRFGTGRARAVKVNWQKDTRDADLMILKAVVASMKISVQFQADAWM